MSNIIESLKQSAKEFARNNEEAGDKPQVIKTNHELTQEQLGDIYFANADRLKKSDQPLVIKVIERPHGSGIAPWFVTSIALLLMAFALFTTKRIFVDVKVIDDKSLVTSDWQPETRNAASDPFGSSVWRASAAPDWERLPVEDFVFEGAAKLNSSKNGSQMQLANSSVAPYAKANVQFNQPVDMSGSKIVFYARGQRGGENLVVAVKDKDNHLAFNKGKFYPFPEGVTNEWQRAEVVLEGAQTDFNPRYVTHLRFEFGTKDANNRPGDVVLVKDLRLVRG